MYSSVVIYTLKDTKKRSLEFKLNTPFDTASWMSLIGAKSLEISGNLESLTCGKNARVSILLDLTIETLLFNEFGESTMIAFL